VTKRPWSTDAELNSIMLRFVLGKQSITAATFDVEKGWKSLFSCDFFQQVLDAMSNASASWRPTDRVHHTTPVLIFPTQFDVQVIQNSHVFQHWFGDHVKRIGYKVADCQVKMPLR
jgi:hypothetical protein